MCRYEYIEDAQSRTYNVSQIAQMYAKSKWRVPLKGPSFGPELAVVVLDQPWIVLELCLEIGEATAQNEDLVRDVFALGLQQASRLSVDLRKNVTPCAERSAYG